MVTNLPPKTKGLSAAARTWEPGNMYSSQGDTSS